MKKLIVLQITGILLFSCIASLLYVLDIFSLLSIIILYTFMGICNIINAHTILMKPIEEISIHDKLTGCYNRTKLDITVPEYENYGQYAIIFFDINNLKKVNDIHGHKIGDRVLVRLSNQLRYWHEYGDLYRIGGDEFIVVVPNAIPESIEPILEEWYSKQPILNETYHDNFVCNLSYGIAYKTTELDIFEMVLNKADENMYEMKNKIKGIKR